MKTLADYIIALIFTLILINVGGIVRLKVFNSLSWRKLKKVLLIINIVIVLIFVIDYLIKTYPSIIIFS